MGESQNGGLPLSRRKVIASIASIGGSLVSGCVGSSNRDREPVERGTDLLRPELSWSFETQGDILGSATVSGGAVYFGSYDGYVYAFKQEGMVEDSSGDEYRMYKYDTAGTNAPDAVGPGENAEEKWRFPTNGRVVTAPAIVDGNVYFGSEDNYFYCVSEETGEENWRFDSGGRIGLGGSATVVDDKVYFASGHSGNRNIADIGESGAIHVLNRETGEEIWSVEKEEGVQSAPTVEGDLLYHGCQDNHFYALDRSTGETVWEFEADNVFCGNRAALKDGVIYAGCEDSKLYALNAEEGDLLWRFETDNRIVSSPVATDDGVYFGSNDARFYAVDPDTGEEKWRFEAGNKIYSSPAYRDGLVYVGSLDGNMYAFEGETGETAWRIETSSSINSTPVVTEDAIYFGTTDNTLYAVWTPEKYREKSSVLRIPPTRV